MDTTVEHDAPGPDDAADELLAEYLAAGAGNPDVDAEEFAKRLPDAAQRDAFLRLARIGDRGLPSATGFQAGARLEGRYVLAMEIGRGGMGVVWRARDTKLGADVAIKLLNPATTSSLGAEDRVRNEVQLVQSISHPGVAKVLDFHSADEHTYFVMELVDGVSLFQLLIGARQLGERRDGFELAKLIGKPSLDGQSDIIGNEDWYRSAARVFVAALRVLEAAHAAKVVHRDIKPSNIMLRGGGHPVLIDFGLARTASLVSAEHSGALGGTAQDLAPEQVWSDRTGRSPATDIYQMGAVLYEFLTLERAVDGEGLPQVLENIKERAVRNPRDRDPDVPQELADICLRAMEPAASRRYGTATAFREDLERWLEGEEAPRACQRSLWRRTRYFARRHRNAVRITAAVILTGLIVPFLFSPTKPVQEIVLESEKVEPTPSDRFGNYVAKTSATLRVECDLRALLFVRHRDGMECVYPLLLDEDLALSRRFDPGECHVRWKRGPIPASEPLHVSVFAIVEPGAFENLWVALHDAADADLRGVTRAEAEQIVEELREQTRAAGETAEFTVDQILGAEPFGDGMQRIKLTGPKSTR